MKNIICIVTYTNPDYLPPVINTIRILAAEFEIVVITRNIIASNQDKPQLAYPKNVRLFRLGKLKTTREKETQSLFIKTLDYITFIIRTIYCVWFYRCQLIYCYDMHAFIAGFFASHFIKKVPLVYHNLDLCELNEMKGLSFLIYYLELLLARYADKIVIPDINRAKFFKKEYSLAKLPETVINAPPTLESLPTNQLKKLLEAKGYNADKKVILFQGAIGDKYYILELINSMPLWPKETILVLIGWAYEDYLAKINRQIEILNLKERIMYIPFLSYDELPFYTVGSYLGLALIRPKNTNLRFNAGASNKIFDYLSVGIPVITNDSPYFREVIDSSYAYFVNPYSNEDVSRVINSAILDKDEYLKKSRAARQTHLTKFNYERQFNPVFQYIREITKKAYK